MLQIQKKTNKKTIKKESQGVLTKANKIKMQMMNNFIQRQKSFQSSLNLEETNEKVQNIVSLASYAAPPYGRMLKGRHRI